MPGFLLDNNLNGATTTKRIIKNSAKSRVRGSFTWKPVVIFKTKEITEIHLTTNPGLFIYRVRYFSGKIVWSTLNCKSPLICTLYANKFHWEIKSPIKSHDSRYRRASCLFYSTILMHTNRWFASINKINAQQVQGWPH